MTVTLQQIADDLEISRGTVSRALRNDRMIHAQTRARVIQAAARMGYQGVARQHKAKSSAKTKHFFAIMPDKWGPRRRTDVNVTLFLEGMTIEADRQEAFLSLTNLREEEGAQPGLAMGSGHDQILANADAVIGFGRLDTSSYAAITEHVPFITLSWEYSHFAHHAILLDNVAGVRGLSESLIEMGHRRMAWVGEWYEASFFTARQSGFIQACIDKALSVDDQLFLGPEIWTAGREGAELRPDCILEARAKGATAFVCGNDRVANLVIEQLANAGISVPEQASVTGFDAVRGLTANGKELSSLDPRFVEAGRAAIRLAMRQLEDPLTGPVSLVIHGRTVPGQTMARAPKTRTSRV